MFFGSYEIVMTTTAKHAEDLTIVEVLDAMAALALKSSNNAQQNTLTQIWKFSVIACNKAIAKFSESRGLADKLSAMLASRFGACNSLEALNWQFGSICTWERAALQRQMLQQPPVTISTIIISPTIIRPIDFWTRLYGSKMKTTLAEAHKLSPLCTTYTYQFVRRATPSRAVSTVHAKKTAAAAVNGEVLKRVFISMRDARAALTFVSTWLLAQRNAAPQEATCMLECGTHDETLRKWVMDVDASISELSERDGFVKDIITGPTAEEMEHMHMATLQMASAVSHALFEMGVLYAPCSFAVTSRHSSAKMSWHITLHALASHDVWRYHMFELDEMFATMKKAKKTPPEWAMFKYVDGTTKRNSKSQYMQILGSTKVKPGCEHDGRFFKREGIFDCDGQVMADYDHVSDEIFYAATSMVIHDPWSIPFKTTSSEASPPLSSASLLLMGGKKRKTAKTDSEGIIAEGVVVHSHSKRTTNHAKNNESGGGGDSNQKFGNLASWDMLPPEPKKWMKAFIDGSFSADLRYIPAMSKPQNWCDDVMRLVNTGRGKLLVYAYVDNPAVCPRFLKIKGAIHTHANRHCVIMCVEETHPSCTCKNYRMFVRCFSPKCSELKSPQHRAGWIEVIHDDYLKLLSLLSPRTGSSPKTTTMIKDGE